MKKEPSLPMPFSKAWGWAFFVALLFLLNYMARSTLSPVMVSLEQDLNIGHAQATSLLLMQGIGFACTQGVAGFIVGRIPPARVAASSLILMGFCLMSMLLISSLWQARLIFLFFGFSAGLYFPAGMATLGSLVYPADWGKAVGIHELAPNVGFILIPLVAQAALLYTSWKGVFAIMGLATLLTGLAFLLWGRGGTKPTAAPSFKGSAEILRNPATWMISLLLAVSISGEFSVFSVLQLFLVSESGYDPQTANGLLSLSRLATPLAVFFGGWAADHWRSLHILRWCLLIHALALACMASGQSVLILTGGCVQALSIAVCFPSLFKAISACFPMDKQPILLSMTMPPAALVSAGIMPWFFGLCGQYATFGWGFLTLAAISMLSVLSLPYLRRAGAE